MNLKHYLMGHFLVSLQISRELSSNVLQFNFIEANNNPAIVTQFTSKANTRECDWKSFRRNKIICKSALWTLLWLQCDYFLWHFGERIYGRGNFASYQIYSSWSIINVYNKVNEKREHFCTQFISGSRRPRRLKALTIAHLQVFFNYTSSNHLKHNVADTVFIFRGLSTSKQSPVAFSSSPQFTLFNLSLMSIMLSPGSCNKPW